ncbi:hypothetical protein TNCV_749671 [Trichonephila clavipes]|nr:hypothetical protein TNCV_749671 [Trichonephila clavipes]
MSPVDSITCGCAWERSCDELAGRGCDHPNPSSTVLTHMEIHPFQKNTMYLTWQNPPANHWHAARVLTYLYSAIVPGLTRRPCSGVKENIWAPANDIINFLCLEKLKQFDYGTDMLFIWHFPCGNDEYLSLMKAVIKLVKDFLRQLDCHISHQLSMSGICWEPIAFTKECHYPGPTIGDNFARNTAGDHQGALPLFACRMTTRGPFGEFLRPN